MPSETMHSYLSALDEAARAIDLARRLRPDPGLDHAIDRLRAMLMQTLREAEAEAEAQPFSSL